MRIADLNGDGRLDVVAQSRWNAPTPIQVWYQTPAGSLDGPHAMGDPSVPGNAFELGDFNGDGRTDVAVIGRSSDHYDGSVIVRLLLQDGDGNWPLGFTATFGLTGWLGTGPLVAGDFSGDGLVDLLTLKPGNLPGAQLGMLRRQPGGGFAATTLSMIDLPEAPLLVDVDGDGRRDIVLLSGSSNLAYLRSADDATAGRPITWPLPASALSGQFVPRDVIAAGDLNGDGLVDLALPAGAQGYMIVPGLR